MHSLRPYGQKMAGIVSMCVAVISSVKSELNFDGLHEQHRLAYRDYDRIKQRVEEIRLRLVEPVDADGQLNGEWEAVLEEANKMSSDAPTIPEPVRIALERRYEAGLNAERIKMEQALHLILDSETHSAEHSTQPTFGKRVAQRRPGVRRRVQRTRSYLPSDQAFGSHRHQSAGSRDRLAKIAGLIFTPQ